MFYRKSSRSESNIRTGRIERTSVMDYAFEFTAKNLITGGYFEFGVYKGDSFIRAYNAFDRWSEISQTKGWPLRIERLYAFDSFKGLPELENSDIKQKEKHFSTGQFSSTKEVFVSNLENAGVDFKKINIYEGYYKNTLTPEIRNSIESKIAILHIDVDLYSSAKEVLKFCDPLLQDGSLIIIDDYFCYKANPDYGVQRAFNEWVSSSDYSVQSYLNYSWAGKIFIVNTAF